MDGRYNQPCRFWAIFGNCKLFVKGLLVQNRTNTPDGFWHCEQVWIKSFELLFWEYWNNYSLGQEMIQWIIQIRLSLGKFWLVCEKEGKVGVEFWTLFCNPLKTTGWTHVWVIWDAEMDNCNGHPPSLKMDDAPLFGRGVWVRLGGLCRLGLSQNDEKKKKRLNLRYWS